MVRIASAWFAALLAALVCIAAPVAYAQGKPGVSSNAVRSAVGVWEGTVTFHDGGDSATTNWTLNGDGTFMAGDGIGGTWSQSGASVVLQYNTDAAAVYSGTIDGDQVYGTFRNRFNRTGSFAWTAAAGVGGGYVGSWAGTMQWASGIGGTVIWTLNADGTFSSNDGFSGTWSPTADGVQMRYISPNAPVLTGTRNGNSVSGSATNVHGDRGAFSMSMQGAAAVSPLAGAWRGTINWPGNDGPVDVTWTLYADGTMQTNFNERGTWTQNGADIEMRYQSNTNFQTLRGRLQGGTITGSADDNAGDPGRFQMSR
jgi:hypothetical protein